MDRAGVLLPSRKRLRIADFDYASGGWYYVTICVADRACVLGEVREGKVIASREGELVHQIWSALPDRFGGVSSDAFVLMPNHVHAILSIGANATSLSNVIGAFKSLSARAVNEFRRTPGKPLWQRSFHDHAIRSEFALGRIREYIANNPAKWELDEENPAARSKVR